MTREDDFIGQLERYLDEYEGHTPLPDAARDAIRAELPTTKQIGPTGGRMRLPFMTSNNARFGFAAVAAVAAAILGYSLLRGPGGVGPAATSTPSPVPTPTASTSTEPLDIDIGSSWTTYTSSQYGLTIAYLRDWNVDPADRAWDLDVDAPDWLSPAMDDFTAPTGDLRMSVWSVPVDPDTVQTWTDVGTWIEAYCEKSGSPSCAGILDGAVQLCVEARDCHPGVLLGADPPFDREVQAFFTGGIYDSQMVVVTVWRTADDPSLVRYGGGRRFIEAHLAPLCVWREDDRPSRPPPCS